MEGLELDFKVNLAHSKWSGFSFFSSIFVISHLHRMIKKILNLLLLSLLAICPGRAFSQNQAPVILNLYVWADVANTELHVYFNVTDTEFDDLEIFLGVSANDTVYNINTSNATGDLGYPIQQGGNKEIVWNYGAGHPNILDYKVRVTADDRYQIDIQAIVDQVDTMNLYQDLQWIGTQRDHGINEQHLVDVRDSISSRFDSYGFEISTQSYSFFGDTGVSIIGRHPGVVEDSSTFINDAHYDAVPVAPGADDNGSGTVGFLEVARILAPYNFRKSIRFIGFDMEEDGLIGSLNYVNNGGIQPWEKIKGIFNYEMIGYYSERVNTQSVPFGFNLAFPAAYDSVAADSFRGNFITNVACDSSKWLGRMYDSITRIFVPELRVISLVAYANSSTSPDLRRSDHAPFWDKGMEAIMLSDGANFRNLNYHTSDDVIDSLNFNFMGNNVKAVVANLCVLAGIQNSDVEYIGVSTAPVSLKDNVFNAPELQLIPNPASKQVLIVVSGKVSTYELKVYDEAGRVVNQQHISGQSDDITLDVSKWSAGVYSISIRSEAGSVVKSLVVQ
ncbi:MAG: hypothetical protein COB85_04720 [Bacteroidetes bacterium]|nr:MAG: hypothetical protein COB85_04720 [Bacteroidota bacterium]